MRGAPAVPTYFVGVFGAVVVGGAVVEGAVFGGNRVGRPEGNTVAHEDGSDGNELGRMMGPGVVVVGGAVPGTVTATEA